MHQPKQLKVGKHSFEYQILSEGKDLLVCFNGYGKLSEDFNLFQPFFKLDYKTIAINLPYHANSLWSIKSNAEETWEALFHELGIHDGKISLLAYSIGARYAYSIAKLFPHKINTIYLIAPDGITPNPISNFATFYSLGKWLMNLFIKKATFILFVLKCLKQTKLLGESDYAFFLRKISTESDRKKLQLVWDEVYKSTPNYSEIKSLPGENTFDIHYVLGEQDKVFRIKRLLKLIPDTPFHKVHLITSGHAMLTTVTARKLKEIRNSY